MSGGVPPAAISAPTDGHQRPLAAPSVQKDYSICWLDLQGRISRWSPGSEEMFGHSPTEARELHFRELFLPDGHQQDRIDLGLARIKNEGSWDDVGWHLRRDGGTFWAASSVSMVQTPNGIDIGCLVVTRLLEPPRVSEPEPGLADDTFRLVSAGRTASHLGHEVSNILSAVRGFAGALERHLPGNGPAHDIWSELVKTCDRGTTFTRHMLGVGKEGVEASTTVDLAELVHGFEPLLRQVMPDRILLVTALENDLPPVVGRAAALELVLLNLVINARDAIEGEGTVAISAARGPTSEATGTGQIIMTVRDSGEGISRAVQDRMFDRFFTTKGARAGTGLGLALVRDTVAACGGSVAVESKPGAGTSFSVHLCPARMPVSLGPPISVVEQGSVRRADVVFVHPRRSPTQSVVMDLLRRNGLHVAEARDATEARAAIAEHAPSVILSLEGTPAELIESARLGGEGPPAILWSGHSASHPVARPGDCVLPGAFCPDLLLAEVEKLLGDAALRRRARIH